jgi:hypothetical protein
MNQLAYSEQRNTKNNYSVRQKEKLTDKELGEFVYGLCFLMVKKATSTIRNRGKSSRQDIIESWDWLLNGDLYTTTFNFGYCIDFLNPNRDSASYINRFVKNNFDSLVSVLHTNGDTNKPLISNKAAQNAYNLIELLKML